MFDINPFLPNVPFYAFSPDYYIFLQGEFVIKFQNTVTLKNYAKVIPFKK